MSLLERTEAITLMRLPNCDFLLLNEFCERFRVHYANRSFVFDSLVVCAGSLFRLRPCNFSYVYPGMHINLAALDEYELTSAQ